MSTTPPNHRLRDGSPTDAATWARLLGDAAYVQVQRTLLGNGVWVSTLWLGVGSADDAPGAPRIFETVVFDAPSRQGLDRARHATEAEALAGHGRLVEKWQAAEL